ncbi:MAG: hypothetical protein IT427_21115 [Pirellulales bacterium]|nr:hypothetical protein [Pirellulales bacterium]
MKLCLNDYLPDLPRFNTRLPWGTGAPLDPRTTGSRRATDPDKTGPLPGWYAVSVSMLHRRDHAYDYFLKFRPLDIVGYSIYIYHITLHDANRARRELGLIELNDPPAIKKPGG